MTARQVTPDILDNILTGSPGHPGQPAQPEQRRCAELRPHPLNETIYGDRADGDLIESVRSKGVLNPILITADNLIVSGHRRWGAAIAAGLDMVPVVVYTGDDTLDIEEALIESNRQRQKTNEQIGREFKRLKAIYNERASRQGQRSDLTSVSDETEVAAKPSDQAAAELGVSRTTAHRIETVVDKIDELQAEGNTQQAAALRDTLNRSANAAHQQVRPAPVAEMFEIERIVRQVATTHQASAADLRLIAKQRIGRMWQDALGYLPPRTPYRDISQAFNNVAEQIAQKQREQALMAPTIDLHQGAGRTPPPPLSVDEIVSEIAPHLAASGALALGAAATGGRNKERQIAEHVLSDFSYRLADLDEALRRLAAQQRQQAAAAPVVVNGERALPAWTQENDESARQQQLVEALFDLTRNEYAEWIQAAIDGKHPRIFMMCEKTARDYYGCNLKDALRQVVQRRHDAGQFGPVDAEAGEAASPQQPAVDAVTIAYGGQSVTLTSKAQQPARHPQHDELFEFSELFKLAIQETNRWASITGEHTAILEAQRGLRQLVARTAAILDGFGND